MSGAQVLLGAVAAVPFVLFARSRRSQDRIFALGLAIATAVYVAFALLSRAGVAALATELVGLALFGAVAWLGIRRAALWLAAGWAAHVGWDLLLHSLAGGGYAPAVYVRLCIGFDLVVAAWIALRPDSPPLEEPAPAAGSAASAGGAEGGA